MISYHPASAEAPVGTTFTAGFKVANIFDVNRLAKGIAHYAWSPCIWVGGYRCKKNFEQSSWYALDFDSPEFSLMAAVKAFCDMSHLIGTTRNHRKDKDGVTCDRFRVLLRASQTIKNLALYESNMRRLARKWPVDSSCCDGGRHFFPCMEIISTSNEGYTEEVIEDPDDMPLMGDEYQEVMNSDRIHFAARGRLPHWVERFLEEGCDERRHARAYGAAVVMLELGMSIGETVAKIERAPISRPYRPGEVQEIAKYAAELIKRRLKDGKEEGVETDKGRDLPRDLSDNQRAGRRAPSVPV